MTDLSPPRTRPLVLILEDDVTTILILESTLKSCGYDVVSYETVPEIDHIVEEINPDLLLLDVMLHMDSGFEVCRKLRTRPLAKHLPIVMITGLTDVDSIKQAFDSGATDFLTKPVNLELLRYRVEYALRSGLIASSLRDNQKGLAVAERVAGLGHWTIWPDEGTARGSKGTQTLLGSNAPDPITRMNEFAQLIAKHDRSRFLTAANSALEGVTPVNVTVDATNPETNTDFALELNFVDSMDMADARKSLICTALDVTRLINYEQKIDFLATHDAETGLPNRSQISRNLNLLLENENRSVAIVMFSISDWTDIRTRLRGDDESLRKSMSRKLLFWMAAFLQGTENNDDNESPVVPEQLVCSLEDGRFIAVCPDYPNLNYLRQLLTRLPTMVGIIHHDDEQREYLRLAVGVSLCPNDGYTGELLINRAECALSNASSGTSPNPKFFTESLVLLASQELTLERSLHDAISNGELEFAYQPRIHLSNGELCGFESLIRWNHPSRGLLLPAEFIRVLEEGDLATRFLAWIATEIRRDLLVFQASGLRDFTIGVNISAAMLADQQLQIQFSKLIEDPDIDPRNLEFEITERTLLEDRYHAANVLNHFRNLGVRISLDDFGTDYSSLNYLRNLPVDCVKIDKSFIDNIIEDERDTAMVQAVCAIAKAFKLSTVGEGVETKEQAEMLKEIGCDVVQGFYFARPMPIDQAIRLYSDSGRQTTSSEETKSTKAIPKVLATSAAS